MSDTYYCPKCERNHKYESKIGEEHLHYAEEQLDLDVRKAEQEGEEYLRRMDEPDVFDVMMDRVPGVVAAPGMEAVGEASPSVEDLGQPPQVEYTDEEILEAIKTDPVANALLEAIGEAYSGSLNAVKQLESEVSAALSDIMSLVEEMQAKPAGPDLLGGFDRFVEKFGLQDQVKAIFQAIPNGINQLTGADPVQSQLGAGFLEQAQRAYLEQEERKGRALEKLEQLMGSGKEILVLDPEDVERARAEGLIKDE